MKISIIIGACLVLYSIYLNASDMTHGEMAGIIRSADYPCAHVLEIQQSSDHSWKVMCNAGAYIVNKDADGSYTVKATIKESNNQ